MQDNTILFSCDAAAKADFIKSAIQAYDTALAHYDFVIADISSDIYDSRLEATKGSAVAFLKEMRDAWAKCRAEAEQTLNAL